MCVEVNEGSYGARSAKDGLDSVDNLMANTRNVPIEEIETRFPLRIERYELRPDPPGAGEWRGGIGVVREVRALAGGYLSCNGDRHLEAPLGVFGGGDGLAGRLTLNPDQPDEEAMRSKASGRRLAPGDVVRYTAATSGGYGDPRARPPHRVLADWLDGYIGLDTAQDVYGVVIRPDDRAVDEAATARLRNSTRPSLGPET